ncbi:hypothetical protein PpBr36_03976 [Pyricularia pennisetigena]|uniref:hypothetical protein n=1 Tax=Pyricularia pennisetigena TaxID=1578925 RepID=UPI00114F6CBA|nr:hypothetical protein PpBr36_03976 [Pyricularia pennisetigena]TLS26923.1 hypothetical protein PpBr36_03976 [Pyricularia pennisetigena]
MNGIIDAFRQSLMAVERKPSEGNDGFNRLEFYFVNQQLVQRPVDQWQRFVAAQGRKVHLTFLKLQLALALALASVWVAGADWTGGQSMTGISGEGKLRFRARR